MTQWYYTKMGLQQGPVPEEELRQKIRRGEIGESNLLWREGMTDWLPFERIPELRDGGVAEVPTAAAPESGVPNPEAPVSVSPPASEGTMQMPQPPAYHGDYVAPNIPNYLWQSLVALGVSCVMVLFFCLPIGVPFAIVAVVYASKVDGLKTQGNLVAASSASRSAKTWMIVSVILTGLLVLAFVGLMVFAFTQS